MRWRSAVGRAATALTLAATLAPVGLAEGQTANEAPRQLVTVVHVHSTASTGTETLHQLALRARRSGIDALVLSENFGYEFRYAPGLLRYLGEARLSAPGLEAGRIERYLAMLEAAERAQPGVVLVPGIEVVPYYYWTGSLLSGDLTLHDVQRNVLVVPAADARDQEMRRLLRDLPVAGNPHHGAYGPRSLALLLPGLLLSALAGHRLCRRPFEPSSGRTLASVVTLILGIGLLWINFPYTVPLLQPYAADAGHLPAQRLFDFLQRRGGLAFWSMPEVADHRRRVIGPVPIEQSTAPYETALLETVGYTGFGGVYADTVSVWEPGNAWDAALLQYQSGQRTAPPWIVGESAYHYAGQADKQLDDVLTVLLVPEPTRASVVAALAGGHGYTLRRGDVDLRLREFALIAANPVARDRAGTTDDRRTVRQGEVLQLAGSGPGMNFDLIVRVEEAGGARVPVQVDIVRDGSLLRRIEATTPVDERWTESLEAGASGSYYRVIVRAEHPAYLVSNPLFVRAIDGSDDGAAHPPARQ